MVRYACTRVTIREARLRHRTPFRAVPIELGKVYRRRAARERQLRFIRRSLLFFAVALTFFVAGLALTHQDRLGIIPRPSAAAAGEIGGCRFFSVHDGDSIRCGTERIRIENIDAPELADSPKCEGFRAAHAWCDDALAVKSRDKLKEFLAQGSIEVSRHGHDKYGRTLARVAVGGRDAGEFLVSEGLARRWE